MRYTKPEIEMICYEVEDAITTSLEDTLPDETFKASFIEETQ